MAYSDFGSSGSAHGHATMMIDEVLGLERGYARGPERLLIAALLFDGVQAYMNYAFTPEGPRRSPYKEAFNWVNQTDSEYVFSFNNCCEALGIDPAHFRLGLVNAASASNAWKKARKKF